MTTLNSHLEIEVKFYLKNPQSMQQQLCSIGARPLARVFETNIRYENRQNSLQSQGLLLRLRQDQVCRLTLKSRPPQNDPDFKIFSELEVEVSDFDTMTGILSELGFHSAQTYEKWRQTFILEQCVVCMDTMPYGDFIEIEGSKEAIRSTAERLGLLWENRILSNYLAMFDVLRKKENLVFSDLTFAHFQGNAVSIGQYITLFQAGR